jgi:hypothetical protein
MPMSAQRDHLKLEINLLIEKADLLSASLKTLLSESETHEDPRMGDRQMIRAITVEGQPVNTLLKRVKAKCVGVDLAARDEQYRESLMPTGVISL